MPGLLSVGAPSLGLHRATATGPAATLRRVPRLRYAAPGSHAKDSSCHRRKPPARR